MARKPTGVDIRRRADGTLTYRVRWRDGGGRDGAWCSHTFDTRAAALDAKRSIEIAGHRCFCAKHAPPGVEPGQHYGAEAGPITFGTFAARHAAALTGVGKGYRAQFTADVERHMSVFADKPLAEIADMAVREWIVGLEAELAPATVRRLVVQAASVMTAGQAEGLVTRNPFKGHRLARRDVDRHEEMRILTEDQWAVLASNLPEGPYRDLGTVLVGTGLRFGEATALAVRSVDFFSSPPQLHVVRAWKSDGASGYELGQPKSLRSRRTVEFGDAVREALAAHVSARRPEELVFTTPSGAPVRHSNFYHRVWRPAIQAAGLDGLRIHDLRHTHVSWLLAAGRPITEISRRLGHESVTTTVDRYGHLLPGAGAGAVAALDAAMPVRRTPGG